MRWLAALLILTGIACAQPQQPPPSLGKVGQPDEAKPQTTNQPAANHERGTRDVPLVIEMATPPNGDAIATEIEKNREDQSAQDRHAVIFNTLLVVVGLLQSAALIYTAKVTNKAANAARAAADALPVLERAYLFIRPNIYLNVAAVPGQLPNQFPSFENNAWVNYSLINHGKTPAVIVSIEAHLEFWTDPPDNTRHIPTELLPSEIVVEAQTSYTADSVRFGRLLGEAENQAMSDGHAAFWFFGSVIYLDIMGQQHATRFRWRRGGIITLFTAYGAPPYNERT